MLTMLTKASAAMALLALTLLPLASVDAAGVCYSPFHAEKYFSKPAQIEQVLLQDMAQIASATGFSAVRTYHAQFYGQSVIDSVVANKLQVAIGIQMVGVNGASYSYLDDDIQAAISAATKYPESVLAIYAGNENLKNGDFGSSSADEIIAVISKVKSALKGTKGANVPVGTVQRLEEWLHATDADRVAAASDVVGVNIYPFFAKGGESDMIGALDAQWTQIVDKVGSSKARLTETGWPSQPAGRRGNGHAGRQHQDGGHPDQPGGDGRRPAFRDPRRRPYRRRRRGGEDPQVRNSGGFPQERLQFLRDTP
jgi:exo-beta-1,3-glucanase (GH17 family)